MHLTKSDVKQVIISSGLVTEEEFFSAENEALRSSRSVTDILIGRGVMSEDIFAENLSEFLQVPLIQLEKFFKLDSLIVELIPESYAKSRGVILFEFDEKHHLGSLAMLDPEDFETINYLRRKLNAWLQVYLITPSSFKFALKFYKQQMSEDFGRIIEENLKASKGIREIGDMTRVVEAIPIVNILDNILEHAVALSASDIHFEPFRDRLLVRYRIDGVLQEVVSLPKELASILAARIKVIANMQIDVHNAPQDGRFRFSLEDQSIDVRVSVIPTFHGEKAEMRLLKGSLRPLSLAELGLASHDLEKLGEAVKKPHGLILVTGPTGSGKTTTLYSILEILNTPKVNITTIEDPIEYEIPRVNQTQVNLKAGLTFATGLRTIVRQNPDIIMIGEIRDAETADISVNAALTGHLLLSTLHTNDAPTAIPRLIDIGVPPFLLASTLNVVVAQRLVRRLCRVCIYSREIETQSYKLLQDQVKLLNLQIKDLPKIIYNSKGCSVCGFGGFRGQIGIFEVLYVTDTIRNLITSNTPTHVIRGKAREEGMRTLFEDGLEKVNAGFTTVEEVIRVASE